MRRANDPCASRTGIFAVMNEPRPKPVGNETDVDRRPTEETSRAVELRSVWVADRASESLQTEDEAGSPEPRSRSQLGLVQAELRHPSLIDKVHYLESVLGSRLIALMVGIGDAEEVGTWGRGERHPEIEVEQRLDAAFGITRLLREVESPQAVRGWFLGMNPELDDRALALILADEPELVAEAARTFAVTG